MTDDFNSFEQQLMECCTMMVSILIKQYRDSIINISDFKVHTTQKIRYIIEHIDRESDAEKKNSIQRLLDEYNSIISNF